MTDQMCITSAHDFSVPNCSTRVTLVSHLENTMTIPLALIHVLAMTSPVVDPPELDGDSVMIQLVTVAAQFELPPENAAVAGLSVQQYGDLLSQLSSIQAEGTSTHGRLRVQARDSAVVDQAGRQANLSTEKVACLRRGAQLLYCGLPVEWAVLTELPATQTLVSLAVSEKRALRLNRTVLESELQKLSAIRTHPDVVDANMRVQLQAASLMQLICPSEP